MRQVASNTPQENLELAFSTAEQHLNVTRLLDPEGMVISCSDESRPSCWFKIGNKVLGIPSSHHIGSSLFSVP